MVHDVVCGESASSPQFPVRRNLALSILLFDRSFIKKTNENQAGVPDFSYIYQGNIFEITANLIQKTGE